MTLFTNIPTFKHSIYVFITNNNNEITAPSHKRGNFFFPIAAIYVCAIVLCIFALHKHWHFDCFNLGAVCSIWLHYLCMWMWIALQIYQELVWRVNDDSFKVKSLFIKFASEQCFFCLSKQKCEKEKVNEKKKLLSWCCGCDCSISIQSAYVSNKVKVICKAICWFLNRYTLFSLTHTTWSRWSSFWCQLHPYAYTCTCR